MTETQIAPHDGKLLILTPGMGAVATTFIAGCESVRRGLSRPVGSLTQMQTIRLGKRSESRQPLIRDVVDLAPMSDLTFGGWDLFPDNAYEAAVRADVLDHKTLAPLEDFLSGITPMSAAFNEGK